MLAEHSTGAAAERIAGVYRRGIDLEEERRGVRDRYASTSATIFWDDDGSAALTARLAPPEDADVVKKAWKAAREDLSTERRLRGATSAPGPSAARALVAMAESFLAHGPAGRGKDRYLAMIHVDADVLDHDTDGRCELDDGPALRPDTARRIVL